LCGWRGRRKGEEKLRALSGLRAGPHAAAVSSNDSLHGGESDACAFKLGERMKSLKWPEELTGVFHLKSGAVVADTIGGLPVAFQRGKLNVWRANSASKFPGVAEKIHEHYP